MSKAYTGKLSSGRKTHPFYPKIIHDIYYLERSFGHRSSERSSSAYDNSFDICDGNLVKEETPVIPHSRSFTSSLLFEAGDLISDIIQPCSTKMSSAAPDSSAECTNTQEKDLSSKWGLISANALGISPLSSSLESMTLSFAEVSSSMETLSLSNFENSDDDVNKAASESKKSKSVLPLIKQELKSKIQLRRLKAGKEELKVDFTPSKHKMSFEELKTRERKREQNRLSALRSRNKQKQNERRTEKRYRQIDSTHTRLLEERAKLRFEKDNLLMRILTHLKQECHAERREEDARRLMKISVAPLVLHR